MINNQNLAVLSEKVAYLENALKTAGVLPGVTASDNGSALQVVDGTWAKGEKIPDAVTANPTGEITNNLSGVQIGDTKYQIGLVSSDTLTDGANKSTYIRNDWSKYVLKSGNVKSIVLSIQMKELAAATGNFEIFKLPSGYEPTRNMAFYFISNTNKVFNININTTGEIILVNPPATTVDVVGFTISYI